MKTIFNIFLLILTSITVVNAQKLVFNEKAPQINGDEYIIGSAIKKNVPSYINFFVLGNNSNEQDLAKMNEFAARYKDNVNFIVVANGDKDKIQDYFKDKKVSYVVLYDSKGKAFVDYGIKYVPIAIITDKRGYFVWQGKTSILTDEIISKYR